MVINFVEDVWKRPSFGYWLVGAALAACVRWYFHIPPPSYAVTFMAVAAGLMALRPEMSGREKWLWTMVLFAFAWIEIRAISHDREVAENQREAFIAEERGHFSDIGSGIQSSILQSQQQFQETVSQQSSHFDAMMAREQVNINQVTGGGSYVIIYPDFTSNGGNSFPLMISVCHECRYAVWDAKISITDPASGAASPVFDGTIEPTFATTTGYRITPAKAGEATYNLRVLARNKPIFETLKVRFNSQLQQWQSSYHIERWERMPHFNTKTKLAEGTVKRVLEDSPWSTFVVTPLNPAKTTVLKH